MKISKLLLVAGLLSGLSSIALAGPGSQYWQNQTKAAIARDAAKSGKTVPTEKSTGIMKEGVCEKCACPSKCVCAAEVKSKT